MLNSFFGCCPLRHAVNLIVILNIGLSIVEICIHNKEHSRKYGKTVLRKKNHTNIVNDGNSSDYESYDYHIYESYEEVTLLNDIFMNCFFMVNIGWFVLEIISNISLKQSTFRPSLQKIYLWLVVYYGNLLFEILILISEISHKSSVRVSRGRHFFRIEMILMKTVYVVALGFQIFIIYSYYVMEKKAMLSNIVQLKWKFVSQKQIVSKGIGLTSASNFMAETSRQTQDGSRIPSYITNVLSN